MSEANDVDALVNCPVCDDGEGGCVYPYYGMAPHTHEWLDKHRCSTVILPESEWPDNFEPDPEDGHHGCGTWTHCSECGAGS